mmetsp:Transcript_22150/g.32243  ORF Transcript_22150/g.32243 Transcript_22150/m.32243 type:complete len:297 (+) Transcript_22150:57-947(+)
MTEIAYQHAQSLHLASDDSIREFIESVDLVMDGIKTAYHVDCFPTRLNIKSLRQLICLMHYSFGVQRKVLVVVLSDDQQVVINPLRFIEKYENLKKGMWTEDILPLNVAGIAPFICTKEMLHNIQSSLIQSCEGIYEMCVLSTGTASSLEFTPQESDIRIVRVNIDADVVGYDFFLGWLLDYVCIYHACKPSNLSLDRPHCLFMEPLLRTTFTAVCRKNRFGVADSYNHDEFYMVTLSQFTAPKIFLADENEMAWFKYRVNKKLDYIRRQCVPASYIAHDVNLIYDEIVLPSFRLE